MSFILIYVTTKDMKEAKKIAGHLIKKRLVACANMFPIKNAYFWKGRLVQGNETVCILKTRKENWIKARDEIKKIHSYETPCIVKLGAEANKEFEQWVMSETK